jgi:hypothetical protein
MMDCLQSGFEFVPARIMERRDCEVRVDEEASCTWCVQGKDARVPCVIACVNSYQRQHVGG